MEKFPRNSGGEGNKPLTFEQKAYIISDFICREQPTIRDFRGTEGFPKKMLDSDQKHLDKINFHFLEKYFDRPESVADDPYGRSAEAVIAYALNDVILPTRKSSYSFLASDYDDKINQTDVVFCVNDNNDTDIFHTFAIQVATTTSPEKTKQKFDKSADGKGAPAMTKRIKYCKRGNKKWKEPAAPHFIIGMMPSELIAAVNKFKFENEQLVGREEDPNTDFKILSELREQIKMQRTYLKNNPMKSDSSETRDEILKNLNSAVSFGLYKVLGINRTPKEQRKELFDEKYKQAVLANCKDTVYVNIINEARIRTQIIRGNKTLESYKKSS